MTTSLTTGGPITIGVDNLEIFAVRFGPDSRPVRFVPSSYLEKARSPKALYFMPVLSFIWSSGRRVVSSLN